MIRILRFRSKYGLLWIFPILLSASGAFWGYFMIHYLFSDRESIAQIAGLTGWFLGIWIYFIHYKKLESKTGRGG
jgi:hypothetical protein